MGIDSRAPNWTPILSCLSEPQDPSHLPAHSPLAVLPLAQEPSLLVKVGALLPLAEASPSSPSLPTPVNTASGSDGSFCGYLSPSGVSFMIAFLCVPCSTQEGTV